MNSLNDTDMEELMIILADAVDKEREEKNKAFAYLIEKGLFDAFRHWAGLF